MGDAAMLYCLAECFGGPRDGEWHSTAPWVNHGPYTLGYRWSNRNQCFTLTLFYAPTRRSDAKDGE